MIVCVIPAYRAARSIVAVVEGVLPFVDHVLVIDDCCPQETGVVVETTFGRTERVEVLRHQVNRGVGGATKTGLRRAIALGASAIVKVDADGQMDPSYIPKMVAILRANAQIALIKGNRLFDGSVAQTMPGMRLFGNSALTLLVRATSGYWNGSDPTNGYFMLRASNLATLDFDKLADRYFFEISLLVELGLRRCELAEIDMPARYQDEKSSLSLWNTAFTFPAKLGRSFLRRILWHYVISDLNIGSMFFFFGALLAATSSILGVVWEHEALVTGIPRTAGTALLVFAPLMLGVQLLLNAVLFDVQASAKIHKVHKKDDLSMPDRSRIRIVSRWNRGLPQNHGATSKAIDSTEGTLLVPFTTR